MKRLLPIAMPLITLLAIVASGMGIKIVQDNDSYIKNGYFILRNYKYGTYITRADSPLFYNFSPYNDYYIEPDGTKKHILVYETAVFSKEYMDFNTRILLRTPQTVASYFKLGTPSATFRQNNKTLMYKTSKKENSYISFISKNELLDSSKPIIRTLSYNEEDVIFDSNGRIYTLDSRESDVQNINSQLGLKLQKIASAELPLIDPTNKLFIVSNKYNGALKIETSTDTYKLTNIDTFWRILEFTTVSNPTHSFEVTVVDDLKELK